MNKLEYAIENHHRYNPKGERTKFVHKQKPTTLGCITECSRLVIFIKDYSNGLDKKVTIENGHDVILGDRGITCPECLEKMK